MAIPSAIPTYTIVRPKSSGFSVTLATEAAPVLLRAIPAAIQERLTAVAMDTYLVILINTSGSGVAYTGLIRAIAQIANKAKGIKALSIPIFSNFISLNFFHL